MLRKNYYFLFGIWTMLLTCPLFSFGQSENRINNTKPHIYLAFEKNDGKNISLSFHNNSKWAVKVCVRTYYPFPLLKKSVINGKEIFALKNGSEYKLCYGVETYLSNKVTLSNTSKKEQRKKDKASKKNSDCDSKQTYNYIDDNQNIEQWIISGESVKFNIPAKYL